MRLRKAKRGILPLPTLALRKLVPAVREIEALRVPLPVPVTFRFNP